MRTRLLSEQLIKRRFPHLRYVRIQTHGNHTATIYAWNEDLQLPDREIRSLKQFASDHISPYVCFKVKSYNMVQADKVPQPNELPESLIKTALSRSLNQQGIVTMMHKLFPYGQLTFNKYDSAKATIHFDFHSTVPVHQGDKGLISDYLQEMIPIGSNCEVTYY